MILQHQQLSYQVQLAEKEFYVVRDPESLGWANDIDANEYVALAGKSYVQIWTCVVLTA